MGFGDWSIVFQGKFSLCSLRPLGEDFTTFFTAENAEYAETGLNLKKIAEKIIGAAIFVYWDLGSVLLRVIRRNNLKKLTSMSLLSLSIESMIDFSQRSLW